MTSDINNLERLINKQINDNGLWFVAEYITEKHLQQELRKLHAKSEKLLPALRKLEQLSELPCTFPIDSFIREREHIFDCKETGLDIEEYCPPCFSRHILGMVK
jgi:DNA mismatch repair ATPase MutS